MRRNLILRIVIIVLCSSCIWHNRSTLTLEKYCQKLLADSINVKYKGFIYGQNRGDRNFILMLPDTTQVFYNLTYNNKINIVSIDATTAKYDSINILHQVQELTTYVKARDIYIIDSKKEFMEVVFDLKAIIHKKHSDHKGALVFCYDDVDAVLNMKRMKYYKARKICSKVLYYEFEN